MLIVVVQICQDSHTSMVGLVSKGNSWRLKETTRMQSEDGQSPVELDIFEKCRAAVRY